METSARSMMVTLQVMGVWFGWGRKVHSGK
jgi:hypothetical protein